MEKETLLDLFVDSERLLAHYQTLYRLAVHLCGPLSLRELMKVVTQGLIESFDADHAAMCVFSHKAQLYPNTRPFGKSFVDIICDNFGPNAQNLREITRLESQIIAPVRESLEEPPLALLILHDEGNRLNFESTCKRLSPLSGLVALATRRALIEEERRIASEQAAVAEAFGGLIGESLPMRSVKAQIQQAAKTNITILILGQTGTGKEVVAKAIHRSSRRKDKPFVAFNCGALPETLIESELFGHVKGAFTGATQARNGLFEQANGGTILLDEVGEMPPAQQVKLLRVLQEGEIQPLGSSRTKTVDVRVIAATNRDLLRQVEMGAFRQDLYYRLAEFNIKLPGLSERGEDTLHLARHFLTRYAPDRYLTKDAEAALVQYSWPGNVRELENAIKHAIAVSTQKISRDHLPIAVTHPQPATAEPFQPLKLSQRGIEPLVRQLAETLVHALHQEVGAVQNNYALDILTSDETFRGAVSSGNLKVARDKLEEHIITKAWLDWKQKQNAAAKQLGISRRQLTDRLKRYGLL